jgi:hypothetical protein
MGPGAQTRTIQKLQRALIQEGELVLITTSQFYSVDKGKVVTKYHVKKQIQDLDNDNKSSTVELFSACSQIQITLFLRDYLFEVQGKEVPTDNEYWNEVKARYFEGKT